MFGRVRERRGNKFQRRSDCALVVLAWPLFFVDFFDAIITQRTLSCASHNGDASHVRVAESILAAAGLNESCYLCGAQTPYDAEAANDLVRSSAAPRAIHNNCSGKHAG